MKCLIPFTLLLFPVLLLANKTDVFTQLSGLNYVINNALESNEFFDRKTNHATNNVHNNKTIELNLKSGVTQIPLSKISNISAIKFNNSDSSKVKLELFNYSGKKIKTLLNKKQPAGIWEVNWDGTDSLGVTISPGIYYLKLRINELKSGKISCYTTKLIVRQ